MTEKMRYDIDNEARSDVCTCDRWFYVDISFSIYEKRRIDE